MKKKKIPEKLNFDLFKNKNKNKKNKNKSTIINVEDLEKINKINEYENYILYN